MFYKQSNNILEGQHKLSCTLSFRNVIVMIYNLNYLLRWGSSPCYINNLMHTLLTAVVYLMPKSHIHGSPWRFEYGLNLTDATEKAKFRTPIRIRYGFTTV